MSKNKMGTPGARVVALITAMAAGVGLAAMPAGALPHAAAHVRHAASDVVLTDLTLNTSYDCVGPCAAATFCSGYGLARLWCHDLSMVRAAGGDQRRRGRLSGLIDT